WHAEVQRASGCRLQLPPPLAGEGWGGGKPQPGTFRQPSQPFPIPPPAAGLDTALEPKPGRKDAPRPETQSGPPAPTRHDRCRASALAMPADAPTRRLPFPPAGAGRSLYRRLRLTAGGAGGGGRWRTAGGFGQRPAARRVPAGGRLPRAPLLEP